MKTNEDRYYCSFKNPQTGEPDEIWFEIDAAREAFVSQYQSDFPTLAASVKRWFVSAMHEWPCRDHTPAIVSRCGGISAKALNVCARCGSNIKPQGNLRINPLWIAITEEEADRIRKGIQ